MTETLRLKVAAFARRFDLSKDQEGNLLETMRDQERALSALNSIRLSPVRPPEEISK